VTVVDAHHHLWDPTQRDYPWMSGDALAPIRRAYTVDDLRQEAAAAGVDRTVLVQTVSDETETEEFLATAAGSDGLIVGVVGWVDLTADDVGDRLARLRSGPGGSRLVGIRHQVQDEPDPSWFGRSEVARGLRAVGAADLVYDLLVLVPQLGTTIAVVRQHPDIRFVLDHAAKPPVASGEREPWAPSIATLAAQPNVFCKLSGLVTEARWDGWTVEDIRPYAEHVLAVFGPSRVLWGSDWPVCELAGSYARVREVADKLLDGLSAEERADVLGGTAMRVYGLADGT
jgi:L-fuconolactonase